MEDITFVLREILCIRVIGKRDLLRPRLKKPESRKAQNPRKRRIPKTRIKNMNLLSPKIKNYSKDGTKSMITSRQRLALIS